VLVSQLVVDGALRALVAAGVVSRCVTSEPQGVGAEQCGQKIADSGISVAHAGQEGIDQILACASRDGRAAM
jgi:hypothetical protein